METMYDRLLDTDEQFVQSPKYHTISSFKDLGKTFQQQISNFDLFERTKESEENDSYDEELNCYLNVNKFFVDYIQFPTEISKKQVRYKGQPSQMRLNIRDASIKLNLIFETVEFKDIVKVKLKVSRTNRVPKQQKLYDGYVTLDPVELEQVDDSVKQVMVHAHLENLLEEDYCKNMYGLIGNFKSEFNVLIEVLFHDGSKSDFTTRSFTVVGQNLAKRKAIESIDTLLSNTAFGSFRDPSENKNFANHQRKVYDLIEANHGVFNNLKANVIKSGKGDIAYHFVLKDQVSGTQYLPGEIVGFTDSNHKVVIEKLSASNAKSTFLKGVVTESQYIEAFLPEDKTVITATICMLGVVPVRVMGPVLPGDGLLASDILPGTAVSEKIETSRKTDSLIGYAFERVDCPRDEINAVQSLVSIISGAGQDLIVRQLSILEKSLKHSIRFSTRRSRKCFVLVTLLLILCAVVVGTITYQIKGKGTLYQKWRCKQGHTGKATYWYLVQGIYVGYQFKTCEVTWKKAVNRRKFFRRPHTKQIPPICINDKKVKFNYYINLDSCSGVVYPGARYMFAVDEGCNSLYYFDEVNGTWTRDRKICFNERCNIRCNERERKCTSPPSPHRKRCPVNDPFRGG